MNYNILITSAGRRVSLLKEFKKELKKTNINSKVFATDMLPELSSACIASDGYFKVPKVTDIKYIDLLEQIVRNNNIGIIIPTIDTELLILSENIERFIKIGCNIIVSDKEFVTICRDKRQTNKFFKQYNIDVPIEYDKNNYKFPIFVKPFNGSRSVDIHIVYNNSQLLNKFKIDNRYMLMQYLNKDDFIEYTVDAYYDKKSELKCLIPRQRLLVRDGEINKGITRKNKLYDILLNKLSVIKGAKGCLTLQFFVNKENESEIYGIEINPRFGGGFPLSYESGGNYPRYIIQEYLLNEKLSFYDKWENNCLMLRYDAEIIVHENTN